MSYMSLAEDEESERSERESLLGEVGGKKKKNGQKDENRPPATTCG